jgi:hypothetical protein
MLPLVPSLKEFATSVTAAFIPSTFVAFGILKNAGLFRDILGIVFFIGLLAAIMNSAIFTGVLYALRVILTLGLGLGIILFTGAGGCGGSGGGSTRTLAPLGLRGGGFLLGASVAVAAVAAAARAAARAFTSKGFGLATFGTIFSTCTTGSMGLDLDLFFFLYFFSGAIFFGSL